mmetsp:Transcript_1737/g.2971  ORF Transcript_1737/g.2971 Transcript_1737/m.2971 type:complete len:82 (+) Transcript_1737:127-372(+)
MSAVFDFPSLLTVLLLLICTCAYVREMRPAIFDNAEEPDPGRPLKRSGMRGFLWKLSRIGERLSPFVGASCACMAIYTLIK